MRSGFILAALLAIQVASKGLNRKKKGDEEPFVDTYEPACSITPESWEGSISLAFKTGTKLEETFDGVQLTTRKGPNEYCIYTDKGKYICMKREGNKLFHKDITAEFQPNGDIVASNGYTLRLYNPCRKSTCSVSFEDLDDMTFQTWHNWDERQTTLDKFSLHKEGEKYCTYGDKSGRHCYTLSGNVLTSERFSYIKGRLQVDGDIKWSHGYWSRADSPPCVSCKVGFEDWVGKKAESYKTDDPEKKIVDTFTVTIEGDQWWNKHWCAHSKSVGKHCMVMLNEDVLTPVARSPFWGWRNALNEI